MLLDDSGRRVRRERLSSETASRLYGGKLYVVAIVRLRMRRPDQGML